MKELNISKNDSGQRIDRFLKKYLSKAPLSFIYKMIRKKNIKLNNSKTTPDTIIYEGDTIQLYLSDETIEKFMEKDQMDKSSLRLNIIYEDENIILINKPVGILSHSANKDYGNNIVDGIVHYLYKKGEYCPRIEKTFTPAICNRLDRNTSGIIIGAKNYETLKLINQAIKDRNIERYYKTIVKGEIKKDGIMEGYLVKDAELNKVEVTLGKKEDSKKITTGIKVIAFSPPYTLLEVQLITGRTHQIRAHLASIGNPIIGDVKYGSKRTNEYFMKKYGLNCQLLHSNKIKFNEIGEPLSYLNDREFTAEPGKKFTQIERELFGL
ncbi:RluA family pseudouridine synthase [Tepidimicrobium xylanilyticum]|uniref:RluA family pseudouridine synthase n=1 Tax=Tepidimicrobium xylanilyticum TaxID=1123352 RepID=UPI002651BDAB|nr:RluA family pseudouridine synthase [Tepidimicrobium xylanilyticum]GMG95856.1 pseudouridine synthase [Tepidimicrobium xylanilyticum]